MSVPAACRAKDPRTCPYHGAVIRMHEAHAKKDFNGYYEARQIVEEKEKQGWIENVQDVDSAVFGSAPSLAEERVSDVPEVLVSASDGINRVIPNSNDPRAQAGDVLNRIAVVDPEYPNDTPTVFHRRRDGVFAGTPYAIRIQANRPLDAEDVKKMASLLGYNYRSTVAGESLGWPVRDTPFSFVVSADTTKSSRDDLGMALEEFETNLPDMIQNGSPVLKRGSRGKVAGERTIDGFKDDDLEFELYYDDVFEPSKG